MLMLAMALLACSTTSPGDATKPQDADPGDRPLDTGFPDGAPPDPTTWFQDADGDGHGDPDHRLEALAAPAGHVADGTDCDDTRATVSPSAVEICGNGLDDNCDGGSGECPSGGSISVAHALRIQGREAEGQLGASLALRTGSEPALLIGLPGAGLTGEGGVLALPLPLVAGEVSLDTHSGVVGTRARGGLGAALVGLEDGFLAGAPAAEADAGVVLLFGETEQASVTGRRAGDRLGSVIASDGTMTVLGVPDDVSSGLRGAVEAVPLASDGGLASLSVWRVEGERPGRDFGAGLAVADLSGDGISDVVVGAPHDEDGVIYVFFGPLSATAAADADRIFYGDGGDVGLGAGIAAIGDTDGDGATDLGVSAPLSATVLRLDGDAVWAGESGLDALLVADGRITDIEGGTGHMAHVGDLDQDGLDDVLAAGPAVFWGPLNGVERADEAPLVVTPGETAAGRSPPGWIGLGLPAAVPGGPQLVLGGPSLEVDGSPTGEVQAVGSAGD